MMERVGLGLFTPNAVFVVAGMGGEEDHELTNALLSLGRSAEIKSLGRPSSDDSAIFGGRITGNIWDVVYENLKNPEKYFKCGRIECVLCRTGENVWALYCCQKNTEDFKD